jgi:energy-coupling factor transport system permease protein
MSLMLSMALRFVPHFMAQLKVIRNGQKCVGMDVSNGKWFKKIRYALNMVSILVTWALENAIETADSMKSRGYGLRGRTAFSIYRFNRRDKLLGTMLVGLCVIFGYGCYRGATFAQYNPRILLAGFTVFGRVPKQSCSPLLAAVTFVSFGVFCFLPLILDLCEESAMKKSRSHVQGEMAVTYRKIYEDMEGEAR